MMQSAECPQCGGQILVGFQPRIGKLVLCAGCSEEFEVVWLDPLELDWPMIDDDFDDGIGGEEY